MPPHTSTGSGTLWGARVLLSGARAHPHSRRARDRGPGCHLVSRAGAGSLTQVVRDAHASSVSCSGLADVEQRARGGGTLGDRRLGESCPPASASRSMRSRPAIRSLRLSSSSTTGSSTGVAAPGAAAWSSPAFSTSVVPPASCWKDDGREVEPRVMEQERKLTVRFVSPERSRRTDSAAEVLRFR